MPELSQQEWEEIFYAVMNRVSLSFCTGDFQRMEILGAIIDKIGPDGQNMTAKKHTPVGC
jgi:hypothetical protein